MSHDTDSRASLDDTAPFASVPGAVIYPAVAREAHAGGDAPEARRAAERRPYDRRRGLKPRDGRWRVAAIVAVAVVATALLVGAIDAGVTSGRIQPGVRVGDIAVGSMTPAQARTAVVSEFRKRFARTVTASFEATSWTVTGPQVGAKVDALASADRAMAVGRTGGLLDVVAQRISALFAGASVPAKIDGDPARTADLMRKIQTAVAVPARDASVSISGMRVSFLPGRAGRRASVAQTSADILSAFLTDARRVAVTVEVVPVSVSDADAHQAYLDAEQLISGPATVEYLKTRHTFTRAEVAGLVTFRADPVDAPALELSAPSGGGTSAGVPSATTEPTDGAAPPRRVLVATFDPKRLGALIAPLVKGVGRPARDARFVAGGGQVSIKASQAGLGPDVTSLANDLAHACLAGGLRTATVRLVVTQPKLTTAAAQAMGINARLGTFTTSYNAGNKPRVNNIHTLATALNDKLVAPGVVFSLNDTVGQRTAAKGYQEANAIVSGKLVPQLGGGICQVGTTFFNAVFFSGLPILERQNHSFYLSEYPTGRDATVSWGGPDLKFRNDTSHWILIRAAFSSSSLTVSLYGTDPGYQVDYTTSPFQNIKPFPIVEVKDPTLPAGARVVQDPGENGCTVTVIRTVFKGGVVVRTDTFVSHYQPKEETVAVGTKKPSKPATSTVTPAKP